MAGEGFLGLEQAQVAEGRARHPLAVGLVVELEPGLGAGHLGGEGVELGAQGRDDVLVGGARGLALETGGGGGGGEAALVFELHVDGVLHVEGDELGPDHVQLELESRNGGIVSVKFGLQGLEALLVDDVGGFDAGFGDLGVCALLVVDGAGYLAFLLKLKSICFELTLFSFEGLCAVCMLLG